MIKTENNQIDFKSNRWIERIDKILIGFFLIHGFTIRLIEYAINRSFWLDEIFLATNILDKSIFELMGSLDYNQAAPIGFLLLTKVLVELFGISEYIFRIIPFFTNILSMGLFYILLKTKFGRITRLVSIILFSVSIHLLRYSSEFKPYSSDVFFALLVTLYGISLVKTQFSLSRSLVFGFFGSLSLLFSFPSLFVLGGVGTVLLCYMGMHKRFEEMKRLFISIALWILTFVILYQVSLNNTQANSTLTNYWKDYFMPFPPFSVSDWLWPFNQIIYLYQYSGILTLGSVIVVSFFVGSCALFKQSKHLFFILFLPLFFAFLASGFKKYPIDGRLMLFCCPALFIFIGECIRLLLEQKKLVFHIVGFVIFVLILYHPIELAQRHVQHRQFYSEEIKPVFRVISDNIKNEDIIYLYYGATMAFDYYKENYNFNDVKVIKGINVRNNVAKSIEDLIALRGSKRVWIVFSHIYYGDGIDERDFFLNVLQRFGEEKKSVYNHNCSAHLFDLSIL